MNGSRTYALTVAITLVFLLFAPEIAASAEIKLDADRISFEETSGVAIAEGDVKISNEEITVLAPYMEYDSSTESVRAASTAEGGVTLMSAGTRINGEKLDYNLSTRRGIFTKPNGRVEAFFVKGASIEVMPLSDVTRYSPKGGASAEEQAAKWSGAVITTCNYPHPHYRLEAKELSVIPNRRIVIRKPKVYLGETLIFTYPFDFVSNIGAKSRFNKRSIFPKIGYESDKGVGIGLSGPFVWDTGELGLEAIWWSQNIWEGGALLQQEVLPGVTAFGNLARTHDKDRDETLWRSKWGFWYDGDWQFEAAWSERELVTVEKSAGRDSRYVVWRKPELNIVSPWIDDRAASGRYRLMGSWGKYEDASSGGGQPSIERYGAGVQIEGSFGNQSKNFEPFYNAIYWYYNYGSSESTESGTQQIANAMLGAKWKLGDFDMESAYLRRWVWGQSPMLWDSYEPREDVYQQIGVTIPTGSPDFWWRLALRGAYSLKDDTMAEMLYKVLYNQHCLQWEVIYRDDMSGDDNWVGLKLTINAYPDSSVHLVGSDPFEPSTASDKFVPDFIKRRP
jgi:LPS-assembly protein